MRAMRKHLLVLTLLLAPSVAAAAGAAPRVVAKIHVGSQPCAGVAAFGSFWQTNYGTATLSRVNPRTNKVTRTGRLGAQPCGIAAGAGSLWIDGYGTSTRRARQPAHAQGREANPRRRQRLGRRVRVRLGLGDEQLRRLGLADQPGHQPHRQDDQDRRPAEQLRGRRRTRSGSARTRPTARTSTGSTRRRTRRRRCTSDTTARAGSSSSADAVWTANGDDTVTRIDPSTKAVVATVKVGSKPAAGRRGARRDDLDPELQRQHDLGDRPEDERRRRARSRPGTARSSCAAASATCGSAATRRRDLWRIRP